MGIYPFSCYTIAGNPIRERYQLKEIDMSNKKLIGTALAAAAALAFVTAPFTSTVASAHAKVKCYGVNSCKGKSQCKTAKNECKHHNACKGQGMKMESAKHCKKLGGTEEETK